MIHQTKHRIQSQDLSVVNVAWQHVLMELLTIQLCSSTFLFGGKCVYVDSCV